MDATTQTTRIDGHTIAYVDQGAGEPVFLVHGIPTNKALWRKMIPELATRRRVIAHDMLNYGESDMPEDANVSIEAQSRVLGKLMDALGVESADVIGHDIGGGVAQIFAVTNPGRVRKLGLMDAVCFDSWPIQEMEALQKRGAEEGMSLDDFVAMMRGFMPQGVSDPSVMTDAVIDLFIDPWSSAEGKRALFRNARRLNPEYTMAIAGELTHLPHETLVLWGREDPFQKPDYAPKLADAIPNASLAWVEGAGHWLMEDRPDEVAGHLARFLGVR